MIVAAGGLALLTACGASPAGDPAVATGPQAFCDLLADLDESPPPEPGGNSAEELTAILAVSPEVVASDVERLRDYHRDVYIEGDPSTDSFENLPHELQAAVERLVGYATENCDARQPDL
jgi:hypothetical protein